MPELEKGHADGVESNSDKSFLLFNVKKENISK